MPGKRRRLRFLLRRDLEETFGECRLGVRARRQHREIFRIVELTVHRQSEQADEDLILRDNDRHGGRDHGGGIGADHEIDFVDVEQLGVDAGHVRGLALIVVIDELHLTPKQATGLVGVFFPNLGAEQRLLAVGREAAGQRHAEADLDRLLALGVGRINEHRPSRNGDRYPRKPCKCFGFNNSQHVRPPD